MEIQSTKDIGGKYQKFLVHGKSGSGKTSLAATVDGKALVLNAEGGLLSLAGHDIDSTPVKNMNDLNLVYQYLINDQTYEWVFLDSLSEIAEVCLAHEKPLHKDGRKAYMKTDEKMQEIIRFFRDMPKNIVFIAKQNKVKDEGTGAMMYGPSMLTDKMSNKLPYFFDYVLCLQTWRDEQGNLQRGFQTAPDAQFEAKDRSGKLEFIEPANIQHIYNKVTNKGV